MKNKFKDKIVLITGAAGGIGILVCSHFAEAGARLVMVDINDKALEQARKRLEKYKAEIHTYVVDQRDKNAVDTLAGEVLEKIGVPDILINNAGIGYHKELSDTPFDVWHRLMDVNFWGPLHFTYAFLPAMKAKQHGHIVNVATGQVFYRVPTWGAYAISKTALAAFSDTLRAEVEKNGIHVTTVFPYIVNTGFYNEVEGETLMGKLSMSMLPFYAQTPDEVAKIIFNAIDAEKVVEMVSPLIHVAKLAGSLEPVNRLLNRLIITGMSKEGVSSLQESHLVRNLAAAVDNLSRIAQKAVPKRGFKIDEVMSGEHEFLPGCGPEGKHAMEFRVTWGPENFTEWTNPAGEKFMVNNLEGTVTIDGLCENAPCNGRLELRYFKDQKIRYYFTFEAEGKTYEYKGEKKEIYPWNLPWSHTTCFGEIREADTQKVVSRSVTHFHWETMPEFLKSLRMVS